MSKRTLSLLPAPRHLVASGESVFLQNNRLIVLNTPDPSGVWFTAQYLQSALRKQAGLSWEIVAGYAVPDEQTGVILNIVPDGSRHPQGYDLVIAEAGISITAATPAGIFYAVTTLIQLLKQSLDHLPAVQIKDWPDFSHRGVMLDISRDKVPTMETLRNLVDMLAGWKINQLQLYTEHTFAYRRHPQVWADASPLTGQEILALDRYCRDRFMELVPNQNTFGHMWRWLIHAPYRPLAECPTGCNTEWGYFEEPFSLCPTDPGSLSLVRSLMDELLPHFSSRQFNVGCDETVDLGQGRSRRAVSESSRGRVYLDFLLKIHREVKARGRTMQFWGDIIMEHPELVPHLPYDVIALEWGYEADHPFDRHGARFAASGIPFYVCPGTSSWNSVAGRTDNAVENLRNAVKNGLKHGAIGYLITDWGDNGHWQPLPVSYPGLAYGAALAWAQEPNQEQDIIHLLDHHVFADKNQVMGRLVYDLGNAYREAGPAIKNRSILFNILQAEPAQIHKFEGLTAANLQPTLTFIDQTMAPLPQAQMNRADAALVKREFKWAADLLRHACRRGLWALGQAGNGEDVSLRRQLAQEADTLLAEHRDIWLARNRPGGLKDSQARLEKMGRAYQRT